MTKHNELTDEQRAFLKHRAAAIVHELHQEGAPLWMAREVWLSAFDTEAERVDTCSES